MKNLIISVPFILLSLYGNSQITRQQAIEIMTYDVVGPDSLDYHHLYSKFTPLNLNESLPLDNNDSILAPFDDNWVFFVDLMPAAFWGHPCQIYFIDISNGNLIYYDKMMPPYPFLSNSPEFFTEWEWILSVGMNNQIKTNEDNFVIAPNPFTDRIGIKYNNLENELMTIMIFDNLGKQVLTTGHYCNWHSNSTVEINTKSLNPGIYFVQIIINNSIVYREKIIKSG